MMQTVFLSRTLPTLRRSAITYNARYLATKPPPSRQPVSQSSSTADASKRRNARQDIKDTGEPKKDVVPPSPASLSLDFSPVAEPEDEPSQRTGARSSKDSLSSIEQRRRFLVRTTLAACGLGVVAGVFLLGREWEEDELKAKKLKIEHAPATRFGRTKERFTSMFDYFSKPTWEELLPPPVPPFQKPYTLLLSIDDLLVTSTWDRQHGWRTAKRPGVDYFLAYMSQFYEIVIFTSQNHYTAIPVIEKLDPYNFFITYKLFRESTRSVNGSVVKDLSYLNRDLSKVIILDTVPEHVSMQPENAIVLPKWKGESSDRGLVAMIPFLESIAIYKPQDIRPIVQAYQGKNIPIEYAKKEAEAKHLFLEDWRKSGKAQSAGGGLTLSSLFSGSSAKSGTTRVTADACPNAQETYSPEPITYLEQKRKEAQAHYLEEQAYITANRGQFDRLLEEERQAAAAQMSGNLWSLMSGMSGAPPPPQSPEQQQMQQQMQQGSSKEGQSGAGAAGTKTL
ncbi:HAD-like protein [Phellopilus nigrolimitatus]|nr:HAD-like protein [Phellopilus nigrolimitatus]